RLEERLILAGRHLGLEAAALNGEGKRALDLVARPHAARTDDAQIRVESEVRVTLILWPALVTLAVSVRARPDPERLRHGAQLRARLHRGRLAFDWIVG